MSTAAYHRLELSKTFDIVNIHKLIYKLIHTNIPNTITKFIANYIKGCKLAYTTFRNTTSTQRHFKTGVPQGGILSPTLVHLKYITHADDITTSATHCYLQTTKIRMQTDQHSIHVWTKSNNLNFNPGKTPNPAGYSIILSLQINNNILDMRTHPKILGLTLDSKQAKLTTNTLTRIHGSQSLQNYTTHFFTCAHVSTQLTVLDSWT